MDTCRSHCTRATAWARDVLAAAVEADRLVPGGGIVVVDANGPEDDDE